MRFRILTVGRGGCAWADEAVRDYAKRLKRHGSVVEEAIKAEKFRGDIDAVRVAEGTRLLKAVTARDRLVCLDERGTALDTPGFAEMVRRSRLDSVASLVFAIGGPYGHAPAVRERADFVVRLSSLVLNHEIARVVLYEQLYRASDLLAGGPYHH